MSFTAQELDTVIADAWEAKPERERDFFMDAYYEIVKELDTRYGKVVVEEVSGGQGDGAPIEVVISVDGRYFQQDGYYSSWGDSQMDGELYEVKPKQVVKTEYERV